jgi:hypothetical protein
LLDGQVLTWDADLGKWVNATPPGAAFDYVESSPLDIGQFMAWNGDEWTNESLPVATESSLGLVQPDNHTITIEDGVISAVSGGGGSSGANPTATAGPAAVDGSASTFMRSDGAPAVQVGSSSQKGILQVDGSTITAASGVISAAAGANPSATAGTSAVNGSAATFMRSDGAPAVQVGSSSQKGLLQVDGSTIVAASGVISAPSLPLSLNSQTANYTTVLGDAQGIVSHPTSDNNARTFTIDSNADVAYPVGTTITFVNEINTLTIAIASDTMYLAGGSSTGSRTLGAWGIATALKVAATTWLISGTNLT